jgi:hypothetical protein
MTEKQIAEILNGIPQTDEIMDIINKLRGGLFLNQEEGNKILLPFKEHIKKLLISTESVIEQDHGRRARMGMRAHQKAYSDMSKALSMTKDYYNNLIRSIEAVIKK